MPNTAFVRLYYQSCEEVLESGVWYVQTTGGGTIDPIVHRDFAREVRDAVNLGWTTFAAKGCVAWGVAVEVPEQDAGAEGPYRFMANCCCESTALQNPLPDAITQRVTLEGINSNLEPVRGGIRMPCIRQNGVDCNAMTGDQITAMDNFFNAVWKPIWSLSGGANFVRVVKSTHEFQVTEFVPAPVSVVAARVVTRQDRVLNKPQCLPDQSGGPI